MLTRLHVTGFKNLVDVDLHFGPFTCIAGPNGGGKSNLFDAIRFLSALADRPLSDAAASIRGEAGRTTDARSLFRRIGTTVADEMTFVAEMLVPQTAVDDLGQEARAAISFLRYELKLGLASDSTLHVRHEALHHINLSDAPSRLGFPHSRAWRDSVLDGRRTSPFISTDSGPGGTLVRLHQDMGPGNKGGGRPRAFSADRLPRTVLSSATASEGGTALVARREMQSWRLLALEPTALRRPDSYSSPRSVDSSGAHMPAALGRLARNAALEQDSSAVYCRVANRLSELVERVRTVRVDSDERRELLTLVLTDRDGTDHEARALSDGTLRFLALAILEEDPEALGVLCLEEPENGIHPLRIPAMLALLQSLAVDSNSAVGVDNPLRQVVINTHSPLVVQKLPANDVLLLEPVPTATGGLGASFRCLPNTWRAKKIEPPSETVTIGDLVAYLAGSTPFFESRSKGSREEGGPSVAHHPAVQGWLFPEAVSQ